MLDLKEQPHSIEAESALLAAMVERNSLITDLDFLRETDFYRGEHRIIYRRLQALAFQSKSIDAVTLCDALESCSELDSAGGIEFIAELLTQSRGPANARSYAEIIHDRAKSRELIQVGYQIAELGYADGDANEKIDQSQSLAMSLTAESVDDPVKIDEPLKELIGLIDVKFHAKEPITGLLTGFTDLDRLTQGFLPGQMIVVAGRPAMGKSTFAMNIAENVALSGKLVIVFNLEMDKGSITRKLTSSVSKVLDDRLKSGKLEEEDWPRLTMAVNKIKAAPLYIDDNATLTSRQIMSRVRKLSNKLGRKPDLVIVDYLQLLNDQGEGVQRITNISRALKMTAKTLHCPLIALSQLSRKLEERQDKRPIMSDLRESGAIEQDADIILMLYRDEVYNKDTTDKGVAEVLIRKNREGENGDVYLTSRLAVCRFDNMAQPYQPRQAPVKQNQPFTSLDRGRS